MTKQVHANFSGPLHSKEFEYKRGCRLITCVNQTVRFVLVVGLYLDLDHRLCLFKMFGVNSSKYYKFMKQSYFKISALYSTIIFCSVLFVIHYGVSFNVKRSVQRVFLVVHRVPLFSLTSWFTL